MLHQLPPQTLANNSSKPFPPFPLKTQRGIPVHARTIFSAIFLFCRQKMGVLEVI